MIVRGECVGDLLQRGVNGLLISNQHFALLRLGQLHARAEAGMENREQGVWPETLHARWTCEHVGERPALASEKSS